MVQRVLAWVLREDNDEPELAVVERAAQGLHRMGRNEEMADLILRWFAREGDTGCLAVLGDVALEKGHGNGRGRFVSAGGGDARNGWEFDVGRLGEAMRRGGWCAGKGGMAKWGRRCRRTRRCWCWGMWTRRGRWRRQWGDSRRSRGKARSGWMDICRYGRVAAADVLEKYQRKGRRAAERKGDYRALSAEARQALAGANGGNRGKSGDDGDAGEI